MLQSRNLCPVISSKFWKTVLPIFLIFCGYMICMLIGSISVIIVINKGRKIEIAKFATELLRFFTVTNILHIY